MYHLYSLSYPSIMSTIFSISLLFTSYTGTQHAPHPSVVHLSASLRVRHCMGHCVPGAIFGTSASVGITISVSSALTIEGEKQAVSTNVKQHIKSTFIVKRENAQTEV